MDVLARSVDVLTVVPLFHPGRALEELLDSLAAQEVSCDLLLVDNSPQSDVAARLRLRWGQPTNSADEVTWVLSGPGLNRVHFRTDPANPGPGTTFMEGMRRARLAGHNWAWLLDQDMRPSPDCLKELLRASGSRPSPAVYVPSRRNPLTGFQYRTFRFEGRRLLPVVGDGKAAAPLEIDLAVYSGMLVPVSFVEDGLVPTDFFIDWDDITMCLRLRKSGRMIILVPQARAVHESGNQKTVHWFGREFSVSTWATFRYYYIARNRLYYFQELQAWRPVPWLRAVAGPMLMMLGLLLWADDRWLKFRNMTRGLLDGKRGIRGSRPDRAHGQAGTALLPRHADVVSRSPQ